MKVLFCPLTNITMMQSKVFVHKETGKMSTIIPVYQINNWREADEEETKRYYEEASESLQARFHIDNK